MGASPTAAAAAAAAGATSHPPPLPPPPPTHLPVLRGLAGVPQQRDAVGLEAPEHGCVVHPAVLRDGLGVAAKLAGAKDVVCAVQGRTTEGEVGVTRGAHQACQVVVHPGTRAQKGLATAAAAAAAAAATATATWRLPGGLAHHARAGQRRRAAQRRCHTPAPTTSSLGGGRRGRGAQLPAA